ncbi:MAG TPA: hypothetical protein VGR35_05755 [Tepidisphaeraceae bacterium]|nr:hypothetical protein [Tepidisphaeraceae bacterium]
MPLRHLTLAVLLTLSLLERPSRGGEPFTLKEDTGYRGIWYQIPGKDGVPKYSGGLATYPQQIRPLAVYAKQANKTSSSMAGARRTRTSCCTWSATSTTLRAPSRARASC